MEPLASSLPPISFAAFCEALESVLKLAEGFVYEKETSCYDSFLCCLQSADL